MDVSLINVGTPYYFHAYKTTNQTISNATYTDITDLIIDGNASTTAATGDFASNSWTPPAGVYFVSATMKIAPPATGTTVSSSNITRIIFVLADSANNQIRSSDQMNEENSSGEDIYGMALNINTILYANGTTTYKLRAWTRRNPAGDTRIIYGSGTRRDTTFNAFKLDN